MAIRDKYIYKFTQHKSRTYPFLSEPSVMFSSELADVLTALYSICCQRGSTNKCTTAAR
jgi:hypothetical protein